MNFRAGVTFQIALRGIDFVRSRACLFCCFERGGVNVPASLKPQFSDLYISISPKEGRSMKASVRFSLFSLCAAAALSATGAYAQDTEFAGPPKVLVIDREFTKPGKAGTVHEKSESAFVKAMAAAKWPTNYIAMDSLTGVNRALFIMGYDTFDAWEKDTAAQAKNAALSAANDRAWVVDGELLASTDMSAFAFRPDQSQPGDIEIAKMRYFDITMYKVKMGHAREWDELVKIYVDGYKKAAPDVNWATYEGMYGANNGGEFLVIQPLKSLAEVDKGFGDNKKFEDAIGESGRKKLAELTAACVDSVQENLFHFNPKMSYPSEHFKTVDPDFWKPKVAAAPKPAAPAQ